MTAAYSTIQGLGFDLSREEFDGFYQEGRREVKRELAGTASAHARHLYFKRAMELFDGSFSASDALELSSVYWEAYLEAMELFPTVEQTLDALSDQGLAIAITTNLTTRTQLRKIEALDIDQYIDLMLTSEETGTDKPSTVMFAEPLTKLDIRASEAVMVGDSLTADIEGGNAVGLETVLFNNEFDPDIHDGWQRPDHHIETFDQLLEII